MATHYNPQSAAHRQFPEHTRWAAAHLKAYAPSLADDPLVWLKTGWRTKALQWLIDGNGQREVILRDASGKFAACSTPAQLVSVPDSYFGKGCAVFYHFSKTYIAIEPEVLA